MDRLPNNAESLCSKDDSESKSIRSMDRNELLTELIKLKTQLKRESARALIAETIIDVAEKEFGISIRKKI